MLDHIHIALGSFER